MKKRPPSILLALRPVLLVLALFSASSARTVALEDPVFDFDSIISDPLDAVTLSQETEDGIVFEEIEFTSRETAEGPERVRGILARPENGTGLPGLFWSMGGMAPASKSFPREMARRGYVCFAITLPHKLRNSFREPFNTQNPREANLTLLARDQMRGITLLSQRPEVDAGRIAVGGASYGGVFATLIAGADPRVKAGFSFFGAGNHDLGTNLPQFLKLETPEDIAIWNRTIDPALRLREKAIPFFWGVPVNDQWFHFPAVVSTFEQAAGEDKRIALIPHWRHGFPEAIDRSLMDFLDTTPVGGNRRAPYNHPHDLSIVAENNASIARFRWSGANTVVSAELVVSFGENTPWLGWLHRASFTFPAEIKGAEATAVFPVPPGGHPFLAWGNITDENGVVQSTPPLEISGAQAASLPVDNTHQFNCFVDPEMGTEIIAFYEAIGDPLGGEADEVHPDSGKQSLRFSMAAGENQSFSVKLLPTVPGLSHRLSFAMRAGEEADFEVVAVPLRPPWWSSKAVAFLVQNDKRLASLLPKIDTPPTPIAKVFKAGPEWRTISFEIPVPEGPLEGFTLQIRQSPAQTTTFWIDSLHVEPIWIPAQKEVK